MNSEAYRPRLRTKEAGQYLRERHGVPVRDKTLRNWRCTGLKGPPFKYFGSVPVYDPADLDAWVAAQLRDTPANKRAA